MTFPRTIREHWDNVGELRCVVTGSPKPTIHHVHGGSVSEAGYHTGVAKRGVSDALVIPLKSDYHTGDSGIDGGMGVELWEKYYGNQMDFIHEVSYLLGYDLIRLHAIWEKEAPPRG